MTTQAQPAIPKNIEREFKKIEKLNDRLIRTNERLLKSASPDAQRRNEAGTKRSHIKIRNLREKLASVGKNNKEGRMKSSIAKAVITKER